MVPDLSPHTDVSYEAAEDIDDSPSAQLVRRHDLSRFLPHLLLRVTWRAAQSTAPYPYENANDAFMWPIRDGFTFEVRAIWGLDISPFRIVPITRVPEE